MGVIYKGGVRYGGNLIINTGSAVSDEHIEQLIADYMTKHSTSAESDPTVPSIVKTITKEDIDKWNTNSGGAIATATTAGVVKPDNDTILVDSNGNISVDEIKSTDISSLFD